MIGWIIIGIIVWLFGICPLMGYLWNTYVLTYSGTIDNFSDWLFSKGFAPCHMLIGIGISLLIATIVTAIIFICNGI